MVSAYELVAIPSRCHQSSSLYSDTFALLISGGYYTDLLFVFTVEFNFQTIFVVVDIFIASIKYFIFEI